MYAASEHILIFVLSG